LGLGPPYSPEPEADGGKGGKRERKNGKENHPFEKDQRASLSPSLSRKERPTFSPWTPIQAATTGATSSDEERAARSVGQLHVHARAFAHK
jgi:hypothetical protein